MGKTAGSNKNPKAAQPKPAPAKKSAPQPKTRPISKPGKAAAKKVTPKALAKPAKKIVPAKKAAPAKPAKIAEPAKPAKKASPPPKVAKKDDKTLTILRAPKPPKAAKASGPKGYTASEYQKFKEMKEKFNAYFNQALKDLLKKNLQSMSGNKDDLVYKCADGATLGRIPRCPKCFGGRPKFDYMKGAYYCSGYRDDADFKNCHSTFQLNEITRDTWEA